MRIRRATLAALAGLALLAACGRDDDRPAPQSPRVSSSAPFTVLAGSELRELESALVAAGREVGVDLRMHYAGTLDIVERVNGGEAFDAILPPNGAYPALALERKPLAREKLFYSRVALGVKAAKAAELGWDRMPPTWAVIAEASRSGRFKFAMTNPASSNTGMSALFAVASAGARKTEDLSVKDVDAGLLKGFLAGQRITAGSSGWLADAFEKDPQAVDGLVNYEAVILRLNEKLREADRLALVYPQDGVISADYPLMLLSEARRDDFGRLVAAIKAPAFQRTALPPAFLRPSNPDAPLAKALPTAAVAELTFPNRLDVIDEVLTAYQGEWRRPSTSIFVLDVSGSMDGERISLMRDALKVLAGAEATSATSRYARFQNREQVVLITFSNRPATPVRVLFDGGTLQGSRDQVRKFADGLTANGGTAIYSALATAYEVGGKEMRADPQRFVSVVLLTDGENKEGLSFDDYRRRFKSVPRIRVFPILFGDANADEMKSLAEWSGGRAFDARKASLASVFKEIRGYQ